VPLAEAAPDTNEIYERARRFLAAGDAAAAFPPHLCAEPTFMLFPFLRNYEFFERENFQWLAALEAATDSIREELVAALTRN
jgi:hypothetical protein